MLPRATLSPLVLMLVACAAAAAADEPVQRFGLGFDELEYRLNRGDDLVFVNFVAWIGDDIHTLRFAASGELYTMGRSRGDLEFQLDLSRKLVDTLSVHAGLREDFSYSASTDVQRTNGLLGAQWETPVGLKIIPEFFVSHDAETSARLTLEQSLTLLPDLVADPRFELNLAFQNAERFGLRSGATDLELGLRLRYEGWRHLMPYTGVYWRRQLGDTADLTRKSGCCGVDEVGWVAGVRLTY